MDAAAVIIGVAIMFGLGALVYRGKPRELKKAGTVYPKIKEVEMEKVDRSYYKIFQGSDHQWYWHMVGGNGEIMATSEGYVSRWSAKRGMERAMERSAR